MRVLSKFRFYKQRGSWLKAVIGGGGAGSVQAAKKSPANGGARERYRPGCF